VLIVEDEAPLVTMLRYNLEREGFAVEAATDGEEALLRIAERRPDAVLLDWMLPLVSGLGLPAAPARRANPLAAGHHAHQAVAPGAERRRRQRPAAYRARGRLRARRRRLSPQPISSDSGIITAAAFNGQIQPSA
jgi:CheY-like chemotaxis protein